MNSEYIVFHTGIEIGTFKENNSECVLIIVCMSRKTKNSVSKKVLWNLYIFTSLRHLQTHITNYSFHELCLGIQDSKCIIKI